MQRVRIGLTGLAFVFVLVLLGAVFRSASNEEPLTPNSVEHQLNQGAASVTDQRAQPAEPLAELGVAPGNPDSNQSGDNQNPSSGQ